MAIPAAENVRVHEDLLRIAAQLPGRSAAKLARKKAAWLSSCERHLMSLPSAAGDVIAHQAGIHGHGGRRNGTLPRVKFGRHVRFIRAHVEAAILDREQPRRPQCRSL